MAIAALNKYKTLQEYLDILNMRSEVIIGTSGGRSFQLNNSPLNLKFKDLTNHGNHLAQTALQACQTDADRVNVQNQIRSLSNILTMINITGDAELRKATACARFLTAIRQFFGNLGRSSHIIVLSQLFKSTVYGINQNTAASVKLDEDLKKSDKKHYKSLSFCIASNMPKIANRQASTPNELTKEAIEAAENENEKLFNEFLNLPLNNRIRILEKQKSNLTMNSIVLALLSDSEKQTLLSPNNPLPIMLQSNLAKEFLISTF